jgi:hypothetical protein
MLSHGSSVASLGEKSRLANTAMASKQVLPWAIWQKVFLTGGSARCFPDHMQAWWSLAQPG